jgi:hypothetical protein
MQSFDTVARAADGARCMNWTCDKQWIACAEAVALSYCSTPLADTQVYDLSCRDHNERMER